ncbi:MAG: helicase C-terminal domain-containing protein [Anaerolineae bacterium]|nr:helicase C-terminal domain-containing protein [Anaerolineae bacterium]
MTTLRQALTLTPWRLLLFIGRQRGLSLSSKISKADLVERLSAHLPDPSDLETCLTSLPLEERQALVGLLTAGGSVPLRYLQPFYGSLRSFRQLPTHYPARTIPAAAAAGIPPLSPLERLRALGLIFHHRPTQEIFIPTDLIPPLRNILAQAGEEEARARGRGDAKKESSLASSPHASSSPRLPFPPVDMFCHDLTCLLALFQTADVRPWHGRWLPPGLLQEWGQCCAVPPASPAARSELQTGRRRFIHYLAESAGWIGGQGSGAGGQKPAADIRPPAPDPPPLLTPTPVAWLWLQAGREARLRQLWQTWSAPQPELWRAYRLPGHEWLANPVRLLDPLHQALIELDLTDPIHFARTLLMRTPALLELVPANLLDPIKTLVETIEQLLTGPLVWLGVLLKDEGGRMKAEGGVFSSFILHPSSFTHPLSPAPPPYTKFRLQSNLQSDPLDSTFTLTIENGLPEPLDLMVAMEVGSREAEEQRRNHPCPPAPLRLCYQITAVSFINALQHDWSPPALLDALNRLVERPLTPQEITLLHVWADLAERVTIRPATLLETSDPAIITRLASTRRGRALIRQTLSPRVIVVDPARLNQLVNRLTEQEGVPPKDEVRRMKDETLYPSSFLWLTCRVYQELGRFLRLPVRLPQTLLDQVAGLADSANLSAAESAAGQVLAELQQVIEGRAIFPAWPEAGLPLEETVPLIQTALASAQNLDLLYYTAGTDRLARRVVEPYRLEWRGGEEQKIEDSGWRIEDSGLKIEDRNRKFEIPQGKDVVNPKSKIQNRKSGTPYLVGFCHTAQAERTFRVDRIQSIQLVPADEL